MEVSVKVAAIDLNRHGGSVRRRYLGGETISHAQPARKHKPPIGVIAPKARTLVNPIAYKLPLKIIIPAKSNHHAPRFVDPTSASTNSAIA